MPLRQGNMFLNLQVLWEVTMASAKEEVRKILDQVPDEASFEDIQYHIYVRQKIERGLKDMEEGRVLTEEEVERRMAKWPD